MNEPPGTDATCCITVTHESDHVIDAFLDGFERMVAGRPRPVHLIVVDNASTDRTRERLRSRGVDVVACNENRGWGAGNNRGLERCPVAAGSVLFLNPDVCLPPAALSRLEQAMASDDAIGAVVPRFRRGGVLRDGALPDYDLADAYLGIVGRRRLKVRRLSRRLRHGAVIPLDGAYPEGACALVRRSALDRVGPFDERFFLFFDDTDFGRRLRAAGFSAALAGDAVADEAKTKGSRAARNGDPGEERLARYLHYLAAGLRYYDKWWGTRTARRIARHWLRFDLPIQGRRWRRLHHVDGVQRRARDVVLSFLESTEPRGLESAESAD